MIKLRESIGRYVQRYDDAIRAARSEAVAMEMLRDKKRWLCCNDLYYLACMTGHDKIERWGEFYRPFCDEVSLMNWRVKDLGLCRDSGRLMKIEEVTDDWKADLGFMKRLFLCYRAFYKTSIITKLHGLQLLLNYPDMHMVFCHNKQENASDNLVSVKSLFLTTQVKNLFKECIPDGVEWGNASGFSIANRGDKGRVVEDSLEAVGVDTEIIGRHWLVAKKNDLVTEKSVGTEEQLKKTGSWDERFNLGCFHDPQTPLQDYEGTRYHFADLYSSLRNDSSIKVIEVPILRDLEAFLGGDDNQITHPERFTREGVQSLMKDMWIFNCFTKDVKIFTKMGYKKIIDISVGEEVFTHKGRWRSVKNLFTRTVVGPRWKIYLSGIPGYVECTSNHPFYIYEPVEYRGQLLNNRSLLRAKTGSGNIATKVCEEIKNKEPLWKRACNLRVGDIAVFPIDKGFNSDNGSEEFWWIIGRYLAEGCLNYSNKSIVFTSNKKEINLIKRQKRFFNERKRSGHERIIDNVHYYTVGDKEIFSILNEFGSLAHKKKLTYEAKCLNRNLAMALLEGYLSGDGFMWRGNRAANSVSEELLLGFKTLFSRHGINILVSKVYDKRNWCIDGRTGECRPLYKMVISNNSVNTWIKDEFMYTKIRKIEIDEVVGSYPVYNIEVEEDHSYALKGIVAKNCQMMQNPQDPSKMRFKQEMIRYFTHVPSYLLFYLLVDPASARKKRSDYTVMLVTGVRVNGLGQFERYIVDGVRDKLDSKQRVDMALDLASKWGIKGCGWESIAFQETDCFYLEEERRKRKLWFSIEKIKSHNTKKEDRIRGLLPSYAQGLWYWPAKGVVERVSEYDGKRYDLTVKLEYEFLKFPLAEHDDLMDTQTFLDRIDVIKKKVPENKPKADGMTFKDYIKIKEDRLNRLKENIWENMVPAQRY